MITVSHLSFEVQKNRILKSIDLSIDQPGITALIGPNGAGKSTLLHCMAGLNTPTSGRVFVDGLDVLTASSIERAKAIALLQQSPTVVSRLKVEELVSFGRWPHHQGRKTKADDEKVKAALEVFDLEKFKDRPLSSLSGGQKQRAFIAMTYAQDTPWLLLDEPLNALDPKHARDLMARLSRLTKDEGKKVVIVLHDINAAARWADTIVAMKDGRIHEHGPSTQVLSPDTLQRVFDTEFEVFMHNEKPVVITR